MRFPARAPARARRTPGARAGAGRRPALERERVLAGHVLARVPPRPSCAASPHSAAAVCALTGGGGR